MRVLQSNFMRFLLIVLAILAVISPFWLFQSDERDENAETTANAALISQAATSQQESSQPTLSPSTTPLGDSASAQNSAHDSDSITADNSSRAQQDKTQEHASTQVSTITPSQAPAQITPIDESNHKTTGTIDLNHLPDVKSKTPTLATEQKPQTSSNTQAQAQDEPDDQPQDSHELDNVSDLLSDKVASTSNLAQSQDKTPSQEPSSLTATPANRANTATTANTTQAQAAITQDAMANTKGNSQTTGDGDKKVTDQATAQAGQAASKTEAQATEKVEALAQAHNSQAPSLSPASQVADLPQKQNAGATAANELKKKIQTSTLHASDAQGNVNSLQQQVNELVQKQGPLELAKYKEAQKERQEQVNWAVDTIKSSSKIYLPEYLSSRAVIVYFGIEVDPKLYNKNKHTDGLTGPTKLALPPKEVYTEQGKKLEPRYKFGNGVHYLANMLHNESGAKLFNIFTVERYPTNPYELYDYAFDQQVNNRRPELTDDQTLDLSQFDTIYLCYAIWWQDMPMPLYSFLDKYDLSGKTLIPICISDKGGFYKTIDKIATAEPNATIRNQWLIHTPELEDYAFKQTLRNWLIKLNSDLN